MRSPDKLIPRSAKDHVFQWLLRKDARDLIASRAFWLLLLVVGLLVGHSFLTAVETYAEMSGAGGGPAVLAQGLSPLDGLLVPTFGAYDIAATFLLPFVVIRLVAAERETGALKLILQAPATRVSLMVSKLIILLGCWLVAMVPGVIALAMWCLAGGHIAVAEVFVVITGHMLLAAITVGVAAAAGGVAQSTASAAIVALTFTLGTWVLDFVAAVRDGFLQEVARYTPSAVVRTFEHGDFRLATIIVGSIVASAGLAVAIVSLDLGEAATRRIGRMIAVAVVALVAAAIGSRVPGSWDLSEDRRNSFSHADERALGAIHDRLAIEVHLGGEDPRRVDLEHEVLAKLRRTMTLDVAYVEGTGTGMLTRVNHYGEMMYTLAGKTDTTRSVTEATVLELIYKLAGVTPPPRTDEASAYPGYPLATTPKGIAIVFFALWPLAVLIAWWLLNGRPTSRSGLAS